MFDDSAKTIKYCSVIIRATTNIYEKPLTYFLSNFQRNVEEETGIYGRIVFIFDHLFILIFLDIDYESRLYLV